MPFARGANAAANPISKVFFAGVQGGDAFVHRGDRSQPVAAKETYNAAGLGIETQGGTKVTMVFSNGLAVQLQANTQLTVKRFAQEPFRPNRTDIALEPSISDVTLDLAYGTMEISTAKLAPGSRLEVQTSRADMNIQGGTMIVTADPGETVLSVIAGTSTIYGHNDTTRFDEVKDGEIARVHAGSAGGPPSAVIIEVTPMAKTQLASLASQVEDILLAKRTVYFEQRTASDAFSSVTTIDSPENASVSATQAREALELNAVQIIPDQLPVQFTISPASLLPTRGG